MVYYLIRYSKYGKEEEVRQKEFSSVCEARLVALGILRKHRVDSVSLTSANTLSKRGRAFVDELITIGPHGPYRYEWGKPNRLIDPKTGRLIAYPTTQRRY